MWSTGPWFPTPLYPFEIWKTYFILDLLNILGSAWIYNLWIYHWKILFAQMKSFCSRGGRTERAKGGQPPSYSLPRLLAKLISFDQVILCLITLTHQAPPLLFLYLTLPLFSTVKPFIDLSKSHTGTLHKVKQDLYLWSCLFSKKWNVKASWICSFKR